MSELDISWNKIRSRGSEALGKMVGSNSGLISLNVSFNGLDALVRNIDFQNLKLGQA